MGRGPSRSPWTGHSTKIWVLFAAVVAYFFGALGGYAAGIGAALAGAVFWWLLIERPSKPTYAQGVVFGLLTQFVAYPLSLLASVFLGLPEPGIGGDPTSPFTGPVPSLAELIDILFLMVEGLTFALIFGIPITVPLGIVGGLVLVAIRRRFPMVSENRS